MVVELIVVEEDEVFDTIKVIEAGLRDVRIDSVTAGKLLRWCEVQRYFRENDREIEAGLSKE